MAERVYFAGRRANRQSRTIRGVCAYVCLSPQVPLVFVSIKRSSTHTRSPARAACTLLTGDVERRQTVLTRARSVGCVVTGVYGFTVCQVPSLW